MSASIEAAEGFAERLLASNDSLDRHFFVRARRVAAAGYLVADQSEEDARALMREDPETLIARLRDSAVTLAITEGALLAFMADRERTSILPILAVAARQV
jgi:hypothetical protein